MPRPKRNQVLAEIESLIGPLSKDRTVQTRRIFANSVSTWIRYRDFLRITRDRHTRTSTRFGMAIKAALQGGDPALVMKHVAATIQMQSNLHLGIESTYLFGKILLDRIADSFAYFFGLNWTRMGSTHVALAQDFKRACKAHNASVLPPDLFKMIEALNQRLIRYRNHLIEHPSDPRLTKMTISSATGKVRIAPTILEFYADGKNPFLGRDTENVEDLLRSLDEYMLAMLQFFRANKVNSVIW